MVCWRELRNRQRNRCAIVEFPTARLPHGGAELDHFGREGRLGASVLLDGFTRRWHARACGTDPELGPCAVLCLGSSWGMIGWLAALPDRWPLCGAVHTETVPNAETQARSLLSRTSTYESYFKAWWRARVIQQTSGRDWRPSGSMARHLRQMVGQDSHSCSQHVSRSRERT